MQRILTYELFESKEDDGTPYTRAQLNKIKYFYHATSKDNLGEIMNGGIKAGELEGLVYLADSSSNAARFMVMRGMKNIIVFKIDGTKLDRNKLEESFDHDFNFFKCRAYIYKGDIHKDAIIFKNIMQYNL
jgi:hypothetical protein